MKMPVHLSLKLLRDAGEALHPIPPVLQLALRPSIAASFAVVVQTALIGYYIMCCWFVNRLYHGEEGRRRYRPRRPCRRCFSVEFRLFIALLS